MRSRGHVTDEDKVTANRHHNRQTNGHRRSPHHCGRILANDRILKPSRDAGEIGVGKTMVIGREPSPAAQDASLALSH